MIKKLIIITIALFANQLFAQPFLQNGANEASDGNFGDCASAPNVTILSGTIPVFNHDVSCAHFDSIQSSPSIVKKITRSGGINIVGTTGGTSDAFAVLTTASTLGVQANDILKFKAKDLNVGSKYQVKFRMVNAYSAPAGFASLWIRIGDYYERETESYAMGTDSAWPLLEQTFDFCAKNSSEIIMISPYTYTLSADYFAALGIDDIAITLVGACGETEDVACGSCSSLELKKNEKYILSGWVKQEISHEDLRETVQYTGCHINVDFFDNTDTVIATGGSFSFSPSGEIIDGWEKITGEFIVPTAAHDMAITLDNATDLQVYFDDIRVHPVSGNIKSFVYDQDTHKLMAELDENNYATFYEYDKEGGMVRVKKETEKGVFTIQESRSGNKK